MNGLVYYRKESAIAKHISVTGIVYALLISSASVKGEFIFSDYTSQDVAGRLKNLNHDEVEEALSELEEMELIESVKDTIKIGTFSGGVKELFSKKPSDLLDYVKTIMRITEEYVGAASKGARYSTAKRTEKRMEEFLSKNFSTFNIKEMVQFFGTMYEVTHHEPHRDFMGKEFGQMKTLFNLYDQATIVKMIVVFCQHYEKWAKSCNMANMLYHKDTVYKQLYATEKRTKKYVGEEQGF